MLLESMLATRWDSSPAQLLRATFILNTWSTAIDHTHQPHTLHEAINLTLAYTHVLWERCLVATISISLFMTGVTDSWRVRLSEEDKTIIHVHVYKNTNLPFYILLQASSIPLCVEQENLTFKHVSPASAYYMSCKRIMYNLAKSSRNFGEVFQSKVWSIARHTCTCFPTRKTFRCMY